MHLEEIQSKTIRSVFALIGRSVLLQVVGLLAQIILGGVLLHTEFGVYIVVVSVMRVFTFFTDLGLGAALIQKKEEINDRDLSSAFTLQTLLVGTIVCIGFLVTPIVQSYANLDSSGVFLYRVLIFTLFISSLKMIPSVLLERRLDFDKQIVPQVFETLTFNVIVIILAINNYGVASFSWAILISSLVGLPIYYILSPWKISFGISKLHARHLIKFGLPFQSKSVLAIIKDDLLIFFLSGVVGVSGIGYWGFAQKFAYYPFRLIVDSLTKVTFPSFSRLQMNYDILTVSLEKSLMIVSLLVFPVLTIFGVLAENAIRLIPRYNQWIPALPSFYFLCAGAAISSLSNILVNVLDATGRVKTTLFLMLVWLILTWLATIFFVYKIGFTGIAVASFVVAFSIIVTIYLVKQTIKFNFLKNIYKPFFSSMCAGFICYVISRNLALNFWNLLLSGLAGMIIYIVCIVILARKELVADAKIVLKSLK